MGNIALSNKQQLQNQRTPTDLNTLCACGVCRVCVRGEVGAGERGEGSGGSGVR